MNHDLSVRRISRVVLLGIVVLSGSRVSRAEDAEGPKDFRFEAVQRDRDGKQRVQPISRGEVARSLLINGTMRLQETVRSDSVDLIVQVEEPALVESQFSLRTATASDVEQRLRAVERVAARVVQLENYWRSGRQLPVPDADSVIRHRYSLVFTGLAVTVSKEVAASLETLPEVRQVWRDTVRRALLDKSVPLTGANRVWSDLGVTGKGVVVAVIDSGIDYRHADLGGCLGPECRVKAGYNFVNKAQATNPSDDNGHGTHVAGIIAANGIMKGVAPDAKLLAVKVLDKDGAGLTSNIIAGIEWAVAHGADVLNLSLGGPGSPDSPDSKAADNAADLGCVVVIAAGNEGPAYDTLGAPGMSRKALTVGASDDQDQLASFSSRGPSSIYQVKPEIVAPGVAIKSTVPKGACAMCDASGFKEADGTSMAAPHVAGAAALLLERHPDWRLPEVKVGLHQKVKDALIQNSVDLHLNPFQQGAGRLDVYAATTEPVVISGVNGALVNFGLDDLTTALFSRSVALTVTNYGTTAQTLQLFVEGQLPPGISANLSSSTLTLAPVETKTVTFSLTVDNNLTPHSEQEPFDYAGSIIADFGNRRTHTPFVVVKSPVLSMEFSGDATSDITADWVVVHRGSYSKMYMLAGHPLTVSVPPGNFDVVTGFTDLSTFVVREGVAVQQRTELKIAKSEAVNLVRLAPIYYNGLGSGPAVLPITVASLRTKSPDFEFRVMLVDGMPNWRFSNVSSAYTFESSVLEYGLPYQNRSHLFHACAVDGINQSVIWRNTRANLKALDVRHGAGVGLANLVISTGLYFRDATGVRLVSPLLKAPIAEQYHLLAEPNADYSLGYLLTEIYSGSYVPASLVYRTPFLRVAGGPLRLNAYLDGEFATPLYSTTAGFLPFGEGPYVWSGRFKNAKGEISLTPLHGDFCWPFLGQTGEIRNQAGYAYELWQGTRRIKNGNIPGAVYPLVLKQFSLRDLTPGSYVFKAKTNIRELATAGQGDLSAFINTDASDPNPPYLLSFQMLAGHDNSARIGPDGVEVRFRAGDDQGVSQAVLSYDVGGGWTSATLQTVAPGEYSAQIPGPPAIASLKLEIKDNAQNSITYLTSAAKRFVDLGLYLTRTGDFKSGSRPTFAVKLSNLGTEPIAPPVGVSLSLPYGLKYLSFNGPGWTCSNSGQNVTCTHSDPIQIADLDTTVTITTQVVASAAQYSTQVALNYAADTNPGNNGLTDYMVVENWVPSGLGEENLLAVAVNPSNPDTMYVGTVRGLFKSTDHGTSWAMSVIGQTVAVRSIAINPTDPTTLYIGTEGQGVLKSTNAGDTWTKINTGLGNLSVLALAIDRTATNVLYAGTGAGVFKTSTAGDAWSASSTGLTNTRISALAISPEDSTILFGGTGIGISKSQKAGAGWTAVLSGGSGFVVSAIVFDPTNPQIMYAATAKGIFKSSDGGDHWEGRNLGLNKLDTECVVIDPNNPEIIYLGVTGGGIYRSVNGGESWSSFGVGAITSTVNCLVMNGPIMAGTTKGLVKLTFRPDLAVGVADNGHFLSGSYGRFTLRVTNVGLGTSQGTATVVNTLPSAFDLVSASGTGWACSATGKAVQCNRTEPMTAGSQTDIGFVVAVADSALGNCVNNATLENSSDSNQSNNTVTQTFSVVSGIPLWFPFYQGDQASFTGFALVNPGLSTATLDFFAHDKNGGLQPLPDNPSSRSLQPSRQLAELGNELFQAAGGTKQAGWVRVVADKQISGFFLFGSGAQLDGSLAFSQKAKRLYFTRVFEGPKSYRNQAATTRLSLVNPNPTPVVLRLTLHHETAAVVASVNLTIPGYGCAYDSIPALFGVPVTISGGYVDVEVTQGEGVVGFELVQLQDHQTLIGLNAALTSGLELYSAQLAEVPGLYTSVKIVNVGQSNSTMYLKAIGEDGQALGEQYTVTLRPGDAFEKDAGEIFGWKAGESHVGSLRIEANTPTLIGDVVFGDTAFVSTAAVPLQITKFTRAVFCQVANGMGLFTGLAFYNPATDSVSITVQVFSPEGEKTGETTLNLPGGGRISQLLSELVPSTVNQIRGYVLISSNRPLIAQQLFGDGSFLAAVPPNVQQ